MKMLMIIVVIVLLLFYSVDDLLMHLLVVYLDELIRMIYQQPLNRLIVDIYLKNYTNL